ncbi:hypothetical protein FB446DRAFT_750288 [Lentinula raphanica]|nr:hypothetical protein FB446DRAFT_750288 [Lentinula raphanica]
MLAKPSSDFLTASSPRETPSFAQSMSECTRKRKHQAEDDDFDPSNPQSQDEKHKTRRINPFKLAERLPAGLVKEMETFIKPGAIMPNFDIRKELQIRYQVDRRHLYDYFHSRGLRVAKEDRHSNLTRSRIAKAKAQAQGDDGSKENIPTKSAKPIKLPPAKRSTSKPKHAWKSVKRPVLSADDNSFLRDPSAKLTAYSQVQETDSDEKPFGTENDESGYVHDFSSHDVEPSVHVTEAVEATPCFYVEDVYASSGRSTPSLVHDSSSSCKSPSPEYVQPEEEDLFSAAEFAAEFLNIPEDSESQDYPLDNTLDDTSAPSILGDLLCPSDRKNMYEHINTNIVQNGTSFALDLPSPPPQTANLNSLMAATALPSLQSTLSLDSYLRALQTVASIIPNAVPAFQPSSTASMSSPAASGEYCIPSATLSNATRVFTPSDFLTPGFRQVEGVPLSLPGAPNPAAYTYASPFHPALQNERSSAFLY